MNRLRTDQQKAVVAALCEGSSINATVRITGVSKPTILKLLRDLGAACAAHHDRTVRGLRPDYVQTYEIWAFNYCKAKPVKTAKAAPADAGDIWTWTALDSDSKLMIAYHVGQRNLDDARAFMLDLAGRITNKTQLTADGLASYFPGVTEAFGSYVNFGQLIKLFGPESGGGPERKYSPGECCGTKKLMQIGALKPDKISTSHVERSKLSIRMCNRRFTRLTNAHSKKAENHFFAMALFFAFYNFCRVHSSLKTTPALKAGLTDHIWTLDELVGLLG